jgi:hypothetical protein
MWPAWLAITMPGAAGCCHATQGFEDVHGADQVDGEDRLRGGFASGTALRCGSRARLWPSGRLDQLTRLRDAPGF